MQMNKRIVRAAWGVVAASLALAPLTAQACTSFILKNDDKSYVYARTFEFGAELDEQLALVPRNFEFEGVGPDGVAGTGLGWSGKYAFVGVRVFGMPVLIDGMNEKGLAGGLQNAPTSAVFQNPTGADAKNSIASYQILNYVLSNFATLDEVKAGLPTIFVNSSPLERFGGVVRIHATLHDLSGQSIVVEYIDGKLEITDNPLGVVTNDPPIKWHLANVANYVNLSPFEKPALDVNGETFAPQSIGSGLHGLPGDFMSPSRFLRAFFFSQAAQKFAGTVPKVELAWHIINTFDIPPGSALVVPEDKSGTNPAWDYTQDTIVADAQNLTYYFRPFESLNISRVDLKGQDLDGGIIKTWDVPKGTVYQELK